MSAVIWCLSNSTIGMDSAPYCQPRICLPSPTHTPLAQRRLVYDAPSRSPMDKIISSIILWNVRSIRPKAANFNFDELKLKANARVTTESKNHTEEKNTQVCCLAFTGLPLGVGQCLGLGHVVTPCVGVYVSLRRRACCRTLPIQIRRQRDGDIIR